MKDVSTALRPSPDRARSIEQSSSPRKAGRNTALRAHQHQFLCNWVANQAIAFKGAYLTRPTDTTAIMYQAQLP